MDVPPFRSLVTKPLGYVQRHIEGKTGSMH
jgi:hypothetical protein